jgi:hypothetical protein
MEEIFTMNDVDKRPLREQQKTGAVRGDLNQTCRANFARGK